ncbi:MAG: hypothetical protein KJ025_18915 [Burkholderiales bacterium]|nr:hypothetical protein [Burkholderiales bacterium]
MQGFETGPIATVIVALPAAALAGGQGRGPAAVRDPRVNQRRHDQRHRIVQGVRSGGLTRDERRACAGASARRNVHGEKHDDEQRN